MTVPHGNVYNKYETGNRLNRSLVNRFLERLTQCLDSPAVHDEILEVGCGQGDIAHRVRAFYGGKTKVYALDPGIEVLLSGVQLYPEINFIQGTVYSLPFPDNSMDMVLLPEVLEHLEDPAAGLKECVRVAKSHLILSVPWEPVWRIGNFLSGRYVRAWGNTPGHIQHWTRNGFVRFVQQYADVKKVYSPFPWTLVTAEKRRSG